MMNSGSQNSKQTGGREDNKNKNKKYMIKGKDEKLYINLLFKMDKLISGYTR